MSLFSTCNDSCSDGLSCEDAINSYINCNLWTNLEVAISYFDYQPWFFSLLGSSLVGLSGIFPILVLPDNETVYTNRSKVPETSSILKLLLSFAVGALLGDIFLHLLPETWSKFSMKSESAELPLISWGSWVLTGFLVFVMTEKIFLGCCETKEIKFPEQKHFELQKTTIKSDKHLYDKQIPSAWNNNNCFSNSEKNILNNPLENFTANQERQTKKRFSGDELICHNNNKGSNNHSEKTIKRSPKSRLGQHDLRNFKKYEIRSNSDTEKVVRIKNSKNATKRVSGCLNLMANCVDNFTHGLAVGGSFLISFRLGVVTTFTILIHEIPHEIGDFAILLKSGFSRLDAAKAQMLTASGGIIGALVAVAFSGKDVETKTYWIMPFTAGGFLHISMVTVLPELLQETNRRESLKQVAALFTGIIIMGFLTALFD